MCNIEIVRDDNSGLDGENEVAAEETPVKGFVFGWKCVELLKHVSLNMEGLASWLTCWCKNRIRLEKKTINLHL